MESPAVELFLSLETAVWEALRQGDAAADTRILSEDFLGVYPSGFADRAQHASLLDDGPTVVRYTLSEERILVLGHDTVLLCYRADWQRLRAGVTQDPEAMFVSSLWVLRAGTWVNVFSQDTPTDTRS